MPTNADYVQLAKAAYDTSGAPAGWNRIDIPSPTNDAGYYGAAFRSTATGEIVVAHRGTDSANDLITDYQMVIGKLPDQYQYAKQFYEQVREANQGASISITGHSLGGALAQLQAAESTMPGNPPVAAVTFNPYGSPIVSG